MADALEVGGLRSLIRTFRELDPALARALRAELRESAEPVRKAAAEKAEGNISHIGAGVGGNVGAPWAQMRVGTSTIGVVYVAPKARNRGGSKRPNLARLLETQMDAALEEKTPEVIALMELMLDRLIARYG